MLQNLKQVDTPYAYYYDLEFWNVKIQLKNYLRIGPGIIR